MARTTIADRAADLRAAVEAADGRIPDDVLAPARATLQRAGERSQLSAEHTVVALAGATGTGKSTIFNLLVGSEVARTSQQRPTTAFPFAAVAESPEIAMDWRPIDFLWNRLQIRSLESELAILHRRPDLIAPEERGPILPGFDIRIGRLDVRQLRIGRQVTGREQAFAFRDIPSPPTPSLLRGFSAPVRLTTNLDPGQVEFLMLHDSDPFNRWQAAQTYATDLLTAAARDGARDDVPARDRGGGRDPGGAPPSG